MYDFDIDIFPRREFIFAKFINASWLFDSKIKTFLYNLLASSSFPDIKVFHAIAEYTEGFGPFILRNFIKKRRKSKSAYLNPSLFTPCTGGDAK
jgi:hypothetical protein